RSQAAPSPLRKEAEQHRLPVRLASLPRAAGAKTAPVALRPFPHRAQERTQRSRSRLISGSCFLLLSSLPTCQKSLCLLAHANSLGQSIVPDEQVHLNPFIGAVFIHGQAKRAKCATLQANAKDGGVIRIGWQNSRQQREIAQFTVGHDSRAAYFWGVILRAELLSEAHLHTRWGLY